MLARSSRVDSFRIPELVPFPVHGLAPFAGITLPGLLPPGISPECKYMAELLEVAAQLMMESRTIAGL
ncbi:unnamed protein product [Dovyalis caffra]|uniref:Uncharacterized protein n=1 Tax=Dovyalis caffra TaxID=77055 RepID=A0AAV1QSE6_9ROSI|nr:unnamed protein product [Dovyalis caffra]